MNNARRLALGIVAAVVFSFRAPAPAAPVEFNLDPARSTFTLGGTFDGAPLSAQSPGSDVVGYTGSLLADIDLAAGTVSIATNAPDALDQPVDQMPTTPFREGANYGLQTTGGENLLAARGMDLHLNANGAPLNGGAPTFEQVGFFVNGGTLYYSTPTVPAGVADLHGYGGLERIVGPLTLVREGSFETLTIPIRTNFSPYTGENGPAINFTLAGQVVATRLVPEPGAGAALLCLALLATRRWRPTRRARPGIPGSFESP